MAHQLTIRLNDELAERIDALAQRAGISRNKAVGQLLRRGAGLTDGQPQDEIGDTLDWLIGSWSKEQAEEFARATEGFETIDEDLWR